MPADYGLLQPSVKLNTPFENLSQVMQLRAQQENTRGLAEQRQSIAEQRRALTAKTQQENADRQATGEAIQQGAGVRDKTLEWARANAPNTVPSLTEFFDKSDEKANTIKQARQKIAADEADFMSDVADSVLKHGGTPDALALGMAYTVEHFPDYADATRKLYAQLQQAQPEQVQAFLEHVRDSAPSRRQKPQNPVAVAPGNTLVDPQTGKPVYTAPAATSPALKEFQDAVGQGYKGTFEQYQTADANRKRPVTHITTGAGDGLDPDGLELLATQYRLLGTSAIPTRISGGDRAKIINMAAAQNKALGQSPAVAIQKQAARKADGAALTQMTKASSAAEAFETKAIAQADIVRELSNRVNRTSYPIINGALLAGKRDIAGDADTQLLFNALTTFTSEYAKIVEGSTGSAAGSSDAARRAAASLVSAGLSKGTLAQTIDLMQKEMRLTVQGYGATIDHITTRMGGAVAAPATTPPPAAGGVPSYQDYLKKKGGH